MKLQAQFDAKLDLIRQACETAGAPLQLARATGSLTGSHKRTHAGRCILVLADDAPGWRVKDSANKRHSLKLAIRKILKEIDGRDWEVHVAASYSCLSAGENGSVVRRDDAGNVIGVHPK